MCVFYHLDAVLWMHTFTQPPPPPHTRVWGVVGCDLSGAASYFIHRCRWIILFREVKWHFSIIMIKEFQCKIWIIFLRPFFFFFFFLNRKRIFMKGGEISRHHILLIENIIFSQFYYVIKYFLSPMTLNDLIVMFQSRSSEEFEISLHYHYFQFHSDPESLYLFGSHIYESLRTV